MIESNVIAIDLAKNVFQVCKLSARGQVIWNKPLTRSKLIALLVNEPVSLVAMESCGGTHYWARFAKTCGHSIKAMSARRVKAFLQGHKTDANDAIAIGLAALQPAVKSSRTITLEEQCQQGITMMRDLAVRHRGHEVFWVLSFIRRFRRWTQICLVLIFIPTASLSADPFADS